MGFAVGLSHALLCLLTKRIVCCASPGKQRRKPLRESVYKRYPKFLRQKETPAWQKLAKGFCESSVCEAPRKGYFLFRQHLGQEGANVDLVRVRNYVKLLCRLPNLSLARCICSCSCSLHKLFAGSNARRFPRKLKVREGHRSKIQAHTKLLFLKVATFELEPPMCTW